MSNIQLEENTNYTEIVSDTLEYRIEKLLEFQKNVIQRIDEILNKFALRNLSI